MGPGRGYPTLLETTYIFHIGHFLTEELLHF